jgi:putative transposase
MSWRNVTMCDQKKQFISDVINNDKSKLSFAELCEYYSISRKTGYKWLNRFMQKGELGLVDLSSRPLSTPTKTSQETEQCIIFIRTQYPKWGPKKIHAEMQQYYQNVMLPSEATIGNILQKHNLSKSRKYRKHVAKTSPLSDCLAPNDVWMYDFKGWFKTSDGSKCEPLTITDGFSRYLIECKHMPKKTGKDVWKVLERNLLEFGLPNRMRSDNGPPFASLGVGRLSSLAIKLIKVGITPEWIEPGCPEENGRHERFHLTLKEETAMPPAKTLALQQEKFNRFKDYYNTKRYHEAIEQKVPTSVYRPSARLWDGKFRSPEYPPEYELRKVRASGGFSWKGTDFFVSEMLAGEYIGLKEIEVGIMGVHYGPILLGKLDFTKGFRRE